MLGLNPVMLQSLHWQSELLSLRYTSRSLSQRSVEGVGLMFSYSLTWLVGAGWRGHASSPSPRRSLRTPCRLRPLRRSGKRRREATCRPSVSSSWVVGARDLGVFSTSGSSKSGDCCTKGRKRRLLYVFLLFSFVYQSETEELYRNKKCKDCSFSKQCKEPVNNS